GAETRARCAGGPARERVRGRCEAQDERAADRSGGGRGRGDLPRAAPVSDTGRSQFALLRERRFAPLAQQGELRAARIAHRSSTRQIAPAPAAARTVGRPLVLCLAAPAHALSRWSARAACPRLGP